MLQSALAVVNHGFDVSHTEIFAFGGCIAITAAVAITVGIITAMVVTKLTPAQAFAAILAVDVVLGWLGIYALHGAWAYGPGDTAQTWTVLGSIPLMVFAVVFVAVVGFRLRSRRRHSRDDAEMARYCVK
jgi:Kef-type K+ transport system membrane component KefB